MHDTDNTPLSVSQRLTNKLLVQNWDDLSPREQQYFGDIQSFRFKKELLFQNSRLKIKAQSLDALIKNTDNADKRREYLHEKIQANNQIANNWKAIDDFSNQPTSQPTTDNYRLIANKRRLISHYRSKIKNATTDTERANAEARIIELQADILRLENESTSTTHTPTA